MDSKTDKNIIIKSSTILLSAERCNIAKIFGNDNSLSLKISMENRFECFTTFLDKQQLCDVVLIAGIDGRRFSAYRLVLAAASVYLHEKFLQNSSSDQVAITLKNINGMVLEKILKFCYTGSMDMQLEDMYMMLAIAHQLQMSQFISAYNDIIVKYLNTSNCFEVASMAKQQNNIPLLKSLELYMLRHFSKLYKQSKFREISFAQLIFLLAHDKLEADSEEDVFHAMMLWMEHDASKRKSLLPNLINLIRFKLLASSFIIKHIGPVCSANDCFDLVLNTLQHRDLCPDDAPSHSLARQICKEDGILVIASDNNNSDIRIGIYCHVHSNCVWINAKCRLRYHVAAVIDNNKLIIIDNQYGGQARNVQRFDMKTNTSMNLSPMLERRSGFSLVEFQNSIYALGGGTGKEVSNKVERYNLAKNFWSSMTPMLGRRTEAAAAVLNGQIYVIGGYDGKNYLRSMECYCAKTKKWTAKSSLIISRYRMGVAVLNGFIFVVGGVTRHLYLKGVERYNPQTNSWMQICSLNSLMGPTSCAISNKRLFAMNKSNGKLEEYDAIEDKWLKKPDIEFGVTISDCSIVSAKIDGIQNACKKCI